MIIFEVARNSSFVFLGRIFRGGKNPNVLFVWWAFKLPQRAKAGWEKQNKFFQLIYTKLFKS